MFAECERTGIIPPNLDTLCATFFELTTPCARPKVLPASELSAHDVTQTHGETCGRSLWRLWLGRETGHNREWLGRETGHNLGRGRPATTERRETGYTSNVGADGARKLTVELWPPRVGEELQSVAAFFLQRRRREIDDEQVFDHRLGLGHDFADWVVDQGRPREVELAAMADLIYGDEIKAVVECAGRLVFEPPRAFRCVSIGIARVRRGIGREDDLGPAEREDATHLGKVNVVADLNSKRRFPAREQRKVIAV